VFGPEKITGGKERNSDPIPTQLRAEYFVQDGLCTLHVDSGVLRIACACRVNTRPQDYKTYLRLKST
jgi:hypothetical protein